MKVKREFKKSYFLPWYEDFIRSWASKHNLVSSFETEGDQSLDNNDDYEGNCSNVGQRYTVKRNVEDLNLNPSKKTKLEQRKSKKNVKNFEDLEEIEIIKEVHEEIKAKQKKKEQSDKVFTGPFF